MRAHELSADRTSLVDEAKALVGEFALTKPSLTAAAVGAALETASGRIYTGINLDLVRLTIDSEAVHTIHFRWRCI